VRPDDTPTDIRTVGIGLIGDLQGLEAEEASFVIEGKQAMQSVRVADVVPESVVGVAFVAPFSGGNQLFKNIAHRLSVGAERFPDLHPGFGS